MKQTRINQKYHFEEFWVWLKNERHIEFINDVDLFHLEEFQSILLSGTPKRAPLKASTINRMFNSYRAFFNRALAWGLIAKNPMRDLKRLAEEPANIKTWTKAQVESVIKALPTWAAEAEYFISETGCRPVDVERAIWGDFDFERRRIKFRSYKGGVIRDSTLPMSDQLYEFMTMLKTRARKQFLAKDDNHVFLNSKGQPVNHNALGKALREVRDDIGCPGITSYGLRHSFIDGLVDMKVHPRDIQLLARHSKFEMTTRYTHRKNDHLREIVNSASSQRNVVTEFLKSGHKVVTEKN